MSSVVLFYLVYVRTEGSHVIGEPDPHAHDSKPVLLSDTLQQSDGKSNNHRG